MYRLLFGFVGWQGEHLFVGGDRKGRVMVSVSGTRSEHVFWRAVKAGHRGVSVARLDIQTTIEVADADFLVDSLAPHPRYHTVFIDPAPRRGCTRYVGSPKSKKRLRLYNKTAQSGLAPGGGGEYLRVELQLRDDWAERGWRIAQLVGETGLSAWGRDVCVGMVPALADYVGMAEHVALPGVEKAHTNRETWLTGTVLPALRKIAVSDPALYERFLDSLPRLQGEGEGGGTED